jgi:hypothetical protein
VLFQKPVSPNRLTKGGLKMTKPTHEDAIVLLKLYEFSGDPTLAKAWNFIFSEEFIEDYDSFLASFWCKTWKEAHFSTVCISYLSN